MCLIGVDEGIRHAGVRNLAARHKPLAFEGGSKGGSKFREAFYINPTNDGNKKTITSYYNQQFVVVSCNEIMIT